MKLTLNFCFSFAAYLKVQNVAICLLKTVKNAIAAFQDGVTILAAMPIRASYTSTPPVPPVIVVTLRYVKFMLPLTKAFIL